MATRGNDTVERGREFFRRVARDGAFAPVFVIHGEERFLVDEAIQRLVTAVFPSGHDDFNLASFHASETKGVDVVSAASMVPMFAAKRVVVLRGADAFNANELGVVAEYAKAPFDSCVLIIEAVKLDGRTKAVQALNGSKAVESIEFATLNGRDVVGWVARRAGTKKLRLARDVPAYLVDAIGTSLGTLDMALDRIDLFIGASDEEPRPVTLDTAREVVSDTRARTVFELVDAVSEQRLSDALRYLDGMLDQGESPVGVVAMLARQFRITLLIRDGVDHGLSGGELARHAGVPSFRVRDEQSTARRFPDARLREITERILRTDHALKSSRLPDRVLVERLIVSICSQTSA